MWTPPFGASKTLTTRGMRSGTVVCPAYNAAFMRRGLYGVRGSDPNRFGGMLDSPAFRTGFPDPVSLTFCPYVVFRPSRTSRGHPRIMRSRAHPRSPAFLFQLASLPGRLPRNANRDRCPVGLFLDRQRPDGAGHLVGQCDSDQLRRDLRDHPSEPRIRHLPCAGAFARQRLSGVVRANRLEPPGEVP